MKQCITSKKVECFCVTDFEFVFYDHNKFEHSESF